MKKILFVLMSLGMMFTAISCSKNEDDPGDDPKKVTVTFDSRGGSQVPSQTIKAGSLVKEPDNPTKENSYFLGWCEDETGEVWNFAVNVVKEDMTLYAMWSTEKPKTLTVMFYSAGGENLDYKQVWKMRQCASIGSNNQVNMTFEYKFSAAEQQSAEYENYKGVLRMDLVDAKNMIGCDVYPMIEENTLKNLKGLPLKQYSSDATMDMSNPDEISKFIKWSVEKHPADKYILIFADHGGGWNILNDEAGCISTKGIIYDDNVKVGEKTKRSKCVSAKNIADGINRSGVKIEVLYLDACLMCAWENLFEYKTAPITYVVSSMEVSYGGNYDTMLKELITSPESPYDAFRRYIDLHMAREESKEKRYVDMGIIATSGMGAMTAVIKDVCDTFKNQINDSDLLISSTASASLRLGLTAHWTYAWTPTAIGKRVEEVYDCEARKHSKDNEWYLIDSDYIMLLRKNHPDEWYSFSEKDQNNAIYNIVKQDVYGLSLGDILKRFKNSWNDPEIKGYDSQKQTAERLYNSYIKALKEMSYINCNHKTFDDQPYVEASPSVNVMAMNENGWHSSDERSYRVEYNTIEMANCFDLEEAIALYSNSTFSKETGWINMLKVNPYNPSVLSNDSRVTRYYTK